MPPRRAISVLLLGLSLAVPCGAVSAATLVVDGSGGGDFLTIQAAVDSASGSDSVLVQAGVYQEQVKILGKGGLVLKGIPGPDFVTVVGDSITLGIWNADTPMRVEGLTFSGGNLYGALWIQGSRVEFRDCVVKENVGPGSCHRVGGGGQIIQNSDALFENCVFEQNAAWESPGGLIVWGARAVIRNNIFRNNSSCYGGGLEIYHCEPNEASIIEGNLFLNNSASTWGGGILNIDSSPLIRKNTFVGNGSGTNAAIYVIGGTPEIDHNIFKGSPRGITCATLSGYPLSRPVIGPNIAWDISGTNLYLCSNPDSMLVADPLFCSPGTGDYSVCASSPAVVDGAATYGAYGVGCTECGPTEVRPTTWGAMKSRYR